MASYYYLIASLPALKTDGKMPFEYGAFLDKCRDQVPPSVFKRLETLTVLSDEGPFLKEWGAFYGELHEELCYRRKLRLGKKAEPPEKRDAAAMREAEKALAAQNPLEAEEILLKLEFDRIDRLTGMHYFDDTVLFGYAMKLKLLERKNAFRKEEGREEFARVFGVIQEKIHNREDLEIQR